MHPMPEYGSPTNSDTGYDLLTSWSIKFRLVGLFPIFPSLLHLGEVGGILDEAIPISLKFLLGELKLDSILVGSLLFSQCDMKKMSSTSDVLMLLWFHADHTYPILF